MIVDPIIIAGSCRKKFCSEPTQAWELYVGNLYTSSISCAICLSTDVYIFSAVYGLLSLNDMVLPYDQKMTPIRSKYFVDNVIIPFENYSHLLPNMYVSAIHGNGIALIPKTLAIGQKLNAMKNLSKGMSPLIDLKGLPDGILRNPLKIKNLRQKNRVGKSLGICNHIGDLFESGYMTIEECCDKLINIVGHPLGLSYDLTVRRQLHTQAQKRGKKIVSRPSGIGRQKAFTYI